MSVFSALFIQIGNTADNSVAWHAKSQGQEVESNRAACALTAGGRLVAATPTQGGSIRCGVLLVGTPRTKAAGPGKINSRGGE